MSKDTKKVVPPKKLIEFQQNFGSAISTPFLWENTSLRTQPNLYSEFIVKESLNYSDELLGWQRIETYNEQYY